MVCLSKFCMTLWQTVQATSFVAMALCFDVRTGLGQADSGHAVQALFGGGCRRVQIDGDLLVAEWHGVRLHLFGHTWFVVALRWCAFVHAAHRVDCGLHVGFLQNCFS
jgi:hypothetical protein